MQPLPELVLLVVYPADRVLGEHTRGRPADRFVVSGRPIRPRLIREIREELDGGDQERRNSNGDRETMAGPGRLAPLAHVIGDELESERREWKQSNGDESDVDCGGSCAGCADGRACTSASDCARAGCSASGTCLLSAGTALHWSRRRYVAARSDGAER